MPQPAGYTRPKADKPLVKVFQKGFITEATAISFPEDAAKDLDNIDIELKGSVRRRLGFDQEPDGILIGQGSLDDETFPGTLGGPLSLAGGSVESTLSYSWNAVTLSTSAGEAATFVYRDADDGNDPNAGDSQLAVNSAASAPVMPISFQCEAQDNHTGAIIVDVNADDFDVITMTANVAVQQFGSEYKECQIQFTFGTDSNGAGPGLRLPWKGSSPHRWVRYINTSHEVWTGDAELQTSGQLAAEPPEFMSVSVVATKVDVNEYRVDYIMTDLVTQAILGAGTCTSNVGFNGGYCGFKWTADHADPSDCAFSNIVITTATVASDGDGETLTVAGNEKAITTHKWPSPNGEDDINFQVIQVGNTLFFQDLDQSAVSLTGGDVPAGSASLRFDGAGTGFIYNTSAAEAAKVRLQSTVGLGRIWFTSTAVIPFYAELDRTDPANPRIVLRPNGYESPYATNSITGARVIRDFNGVQDNLDVDEQSATITPAHAYNLLNQGWINDYIDEYEASASVYPSNAQQWFIGKNSLNNFDPAELLKIDTGTTQVPRGRFTIDALVGSKDGRAHSIAALVSPIDFDGLHDEKASSGWTANAFFAGRVFYAGERNQKRPNGVYFSKSLQSPRDSGSFFQEADPTSENISDLIATDGGVIYITEADRIRRLVPFGAGLLVMASNGIWFLYGGEGGFTASNYSVEKISSTGILSPQTVIEADQAILFWAENSIHAIQAGQGLPVITDLGEDTILTFYNAIPLEVRDLAMGGYDPVSKTAVWMYTDEIDPDASDSQFTRALLLNLRTGGFTKYSFTDVADGSEFWGVGPGFAARIAVVAQEEEQLFLNDEVTPVTLNDDVTLLYVLDSVTSSTALSGLRMKFLWIDGRPGNMGIRLVEPNSLTFKDFGTMDETSDYVSYVEAFDANLGDLQRKKQVTYLHSFFNRTEVGFDEDLVARHQSGCMVSARWDWHNTGTGNRWGTPQKAYRYRRSYAPVSSDDTYDTGESVVYTKLKIRGQGRAVRYYYESESGKDFQLLGYNTSFTADEV